LATESQKIVRMSCAAAYPPCGRNRVETVRASRYDRQVAGHGIEGRFGNHRHRNIEAQDLYDTAELVRNPVRLLVVDTAGSGRILNKATT